MSKTFDWALELDAAITICDKQFVITYMNEKSIAEFEKFGGQKL